VTRRLAPCGQPNTLSVVVVRWSDGAYLEDQDAWKLSGLVREVRTQNQHTTARPPRTTTTTARNNTLSRTNENRSVDHARGLDKARRRLAQRRAPSRR
jgi:beta-galactosidase/beta-glucuronidase